MCCWMNEFHILQVHMNACSCAMFLLLLNSHNCTVLFVRLKSHRSGTRITQPWMWLTNQPDFYEMHCNLAHKLNVTVACQHQSWRGNEHKIPSVTCQNVFSVSTTLYREQMIAVLITLPCNKVFPDSLLSLQQNWLISPHRLIWKVFHLICYFWGGLLLFFIQAHYTPIISFTEVIWVLILTSLKTGNRVVHPDSVSVSLA